MSAYEFLEERFGYGARCYTSCFYLISRLFPLRAGPFPDGQGHPAP